MANKKYKLIELDPWLEPFTGDIDLRMQHYWDTRHTLVGDGDLASFANGYMFFGLARTKNGWVYREWAPGADDMHLIGDFNNWDRLANPMHRTETGIWEVKIKGRDTIRHGQKIKVQVTRNGRKFDRIPLYINRVTQDKLTRGFVGEVWSPEKPFRCGSQRHGGFWPGTCDKYKQYGSELSVELFRRASLDKLHPRCTEQPGVYARCHLRSLRRHLPISRHTHYRQ